MTAKWEKRRIVGTGLIVLDVTVRSDASADAHQVWAGGTCGNVLSIMSLLGWSSIAIGRIGADGASAALLRDLEDSGVDTDRLDREEAGTPLIMHRVARNSGGARHSFRFACPTCETRYPSFRPVTSARADEANLEFAKTDVFFFDRASRGILEIAARARAAGAFIVFEPSATTEEHHFLEAVRVADVIKYAQERHAKFDGALKRAIAGRPPALEIETRGASGLAYRTVSTRKWTARPALPVASVRDTAGAGDWLSAGLIHELARSSGSGEQIAVHSAALDAAFQLGERMAAFNCQFEGPRGATYASTDVASASVLVGVDLPIKRVLTSKKKRPALEMTFTSLCAACTRRAKRLSSSKAARASR